MASDDSRSADEFSIVPLMDDDNNNEFVGSGLMEPPTADGDLAIEEHRHHMHLLWQDLGVGKRGFLTMDELASVCKKIGLEQMNNEEIQQMFDKLDVDCDGRVSFDEFVHGLFRYGGPNAILSPSRQLSSTPRQKLRRALSRQMEEQRQTPSLITSGSGLFSALDIDNTGYAKPEDIIALWESFGISQGAEILEYLQFSLTCKINLMELSYALEQEMRSVEEDNATYQAAIASYDYELRFLKQQTEHLVAERNKLKADLTEINNRVTLLVKEGDERYSLLEKSKEKERAELEKKYQDQIRSLQSELDRERETFYNQSSNEAQKLQSTLNNLKEEETRLKDRVASVQRDYDRLEQENRDMAEKYAELESKKERLQKDLEATAELQHKLEEMESSRDLFIDEHERFSEQQLHQLQAENKELKDKADEMTVQIEELHQQVLAHKRHFGYLAGHHGGEGSMEYSSLFRGDNYSPQGTGDEASEDDVDNVRVRRKLPRRPDDGQPDGEKGSNIVSLLAEKLQDEVNELQREKESLLSQHQLELQSLERQNHENTTLLMNHNQEQMKMQQTEFERKLNALQEEHDKVVQSIRKDHQEIIKSLEGHYQERLKEQKQAYESQLEQEQSETTRRLKALRDDHELELTLLQSKHEERVEKLEREHAEKISEATQLEGGIREYEDKVKVMEVKHAQDLKELTDKFHEAADEKENRHVEELQQMKEEYENKMNALESRHAEELEALQEEHEKRTKEMESQHEEVVDSLQTEHDEEVRGLQQKLEGLCSESSIKTEEVMALQRGFSLERKDIEDAYKMEIAEMEDRHMQEVNELLKEARREKEKVEAEFECRLKEKLEEQETKIRQELEQEKQDLMIKMESEKNLLRVDFEKEKERLVTEHQLDVAKKEAEIQKLEGKTKMQVEELEKQKAAYELQLKLQREESELEFRKEKLNMVERFDEEKSKLLEKHRSDIYEYENIFVKGTDGLRGKLHGDFFRLLEEHKQKEEDKLQTKLEEELQKEKQHLVEQLTKENATRLEETIREKELVEQEKDLLIRDLDAIRDRQKVEAEEERRRIIDELTKEKELLEQEWMAEKDRLSKFGVVRGLGGLRHDGECSVVHETREVQREVSHSVYEVSRECEKLRRAGLSGSMSGQGGAVVLRETEVVSRHSDHVTETEVTETLNDDSIQDTERKNTVNDVKIETVKTETEGGKSTLKERINKTDSSVTELEKVTKKNGNIVKREFIKKDTNNNRAAGNNDFMNSDAVLVALTPIDPDSLENANFTDKQKEFIRRWRSKSNVKDKIKLFSDRDSLPEKYLSRPADRPVPGRGTPSNLSDAELLLRNKQIAEDDVQCQNIYPNVIIKEMPETYKNQAFSHCNKSRSDVEGVCDRCMSCSGKSLDKDLESAARNDSVHEVEERSVTPRFDDDQKVGKTAKYDAPTGDVVTSEKEQTKIIKQVHREKEVVTRTKLIDGRREKEGREPGAARMSNARPGPGQFIYPQQTSSTPKNMPPRKKPRLEKPINLPPETDWVYIRQRKRDTSFLVSVFSIFLRFHMAKNGW